MKISMTAHATEGRHINSTWLLRKYQISKLLLPRPRRKRNWDVCCVSI